LPFAGGCAAKRYVILSAAKNPFPAAG